MNYFGGYERFSTISKKDAALLIGADNTVGDIYNIECKFEDGVHKAYLINRFNQCIGCLEPDASRIVSQCTANDMTCIGILSFVAFTSQPDDSCYWGEIALICYKDSQKQAFGNFINGISSLISEGIRPNVDLGAEGVGKIVESDGKWLPSERVPYPEIDKNTAYIKKRRKATEKLIEQGRSGNKGCYIISWLFLLAVVAAVVFTLKGCGAF